MALPNINKLPSGEPALRIAGFTEDSIVDGPGVRSVLWVQGCPHHCKGCQNPQTHRFNAGALVPVQAVVSWMQDFQYHSGITLSGGEPMEQAANLRVFLDSLPTMNVWCYTGYTFEECLEDPDKKKLLEKVDVLVDGKFEIEKMPGGKWRGSSNQRLIDVQKSLKENRTILWEN